MATSIDDNETDEKSDKPKCQLINIRCTRLRNQNKYRSEDAYERIYYQLLFYRRSV